CRFDVLLVLLSCSNTSFYSHGLCSFPCVLQETLNALGDLSSKKTLVLLSTLVAACLLVAQVTDTSATNHKFATTGDLYAVFSAAVRLSTAVRVLFLQRFAGSFHFSHYLLLTTILRLRPAI